MRKIKFRTIQLIFVALFCSVNIFGQSFNFSCIHSKYKPLLFFYNNNNIYIDNIISGIPFKANSDSLSSLILKPVNPHFGQIGMNDILINPNDSLHGELNLKAQFIYHGDSSSANFYIYKIQADIFNLRKPYKAGSNIKEYELIFEKIKDYKDSIIRHLEGTIKHSFDIRAKLAIKEYVMMQFALFAVNPLVLNNEVGLQYLKDKIFKNIKISKPEYWLQTQTGHYFLKNYYSNILLPLSNYDFNIALNDPLLSSINIKKYVSIYYFDKYLQNPLSFNASPTVVSNNYNLFLSKFKFSESEKSETLPILKSKLNRIGKNVLNIIVSQDIEDLTGKKLSSEEKIKIFKQGNLLLDIWASWCIPCREKMGKLKSDFIKINKKDFKIIFLSLDENSTNWKTANYPYLNQFNSFRIIPAKENSFLDEFKISAIPRYILISNSLLVSDHFDF